MPAPTRTATALAPRQRKESRHFDKGDALRAIGLVDEAVEEYREAAVARPDDRPLLDEACRTFLDLQRFDRALWTARRLLVPLRAHERGKAPVPAFWTCLYPLAHWPAVTDSARERGIDPLLVMAVMREESAFAPRAVSGAGARGLMQVMPHTGERLAREQAMLLWPGILDVPDSNIRLGTSHLAELLRAHGGNVARALASYNAGPIPVQRWLERFGFEDEEAFIEDVPYAETRGYVKRVLGTYTRYRELYGESAESRVPSAQSPAPGAESALPSAEPALPPAEGPGPSLPDEPGAGPEPVFPLP